MSVRFLGPNGDGGLKFACAGTYMDSHLQQFQVPPHCLGGGVPMGPAVHMCSLLVLVAA